MRKLNRFVAVVFHLVFVIALADGQSAVDVEEVRLDKEVAFTVCPMGEFLPHTYCNKESVRVKITTLSKEPISKNLTVYYVPTAGKIVGQGTEVFWDLADVSPGSYSVTVGIGAGEVIRGRVITKSVKLQECYSCDPPRVCPSLTVTAPSGDVRASDVFLLRANALGGDQRDRLRYKWTVTNGTIVSGEETSEVLIRTPNEGSGKKIGATLQVSGFYSYGCLDAVETSVQVRNR